MLQNFLDPIAKEEILGGRGFITRDPETYFPYGPELHHAAPEPHVQAELPQSMTEVEFKKQRLAAREERVSRREEAGCKARSRS